MIKRQELVALASDGRPNFNLLQNYRSAESHIIYYAFDVLRSKVATYTATALGEKGSAALDSAGQ